MNIKRILIPLLIILLLFSIVVFGAPTYVNLGPTSEITGDVGVPDGSGYYINDILFSTAGLIDISTLAKTDGGIIVGDGTNFVLETGVTVRASLGLTIGSDVQAYDAGLLSLAGLTYVSDSFIKVTATDTYAIRTIAEVKTDLSLNYVENLKVKLDATQAPTVNNDVDEGYTVGSRWFDVTNDKEYACLDNTDGAAVWTETTQSGGGGAFTDLTDTPANYTGSSLKHVRVNVGETALEFVTLGGGGDMLKATYDTDDDGDIDVAAGGTEKSLWTQYCIPYLSGTTAFGEIPIGTDNYALTVNGATGYDWTHLQEYDATLLSLAALGTAADKLAYTTALDTWAETAITSFGRSFIDDVDASAGRTTLGAAASGANTDITSIYNISLKFGRDADNLIDFTTDNKILFRVNAADKMEMLSTGELDMNAGSVGFTLQSTTGDGTTTIDWKLGNKFKFTFGAQNETFTFTAPTNPCTLMLTLIQDATGSRTVTWPATVKWAGGIAPTLTTTANARDKVALDWDGAQYDGVCSKDFK